MPRPQREDAYACANAGAPDNGSGSPAPDDCWHEMEGLAANGDQAAWASVAGQRPASGDRVSRPVDAIGHDIIARLLRAHAQTADAANSACGAPDAVDVATFTGHVLAGDDTAPQAQLATLRGRGVSDESPYIHLLAPTARHLGAPWEDDRCHCTEVTMGLGRLQQIMHGLSAAFDTDIACRCRRAARLVDAGTGRTSHLRPVHGGQVFCPRQLEGGRCHGPQIRQTSRQGETRMVRSGRHVCGLHNPAGRAQGQHRAGAPAFAQPCGGGDGGRPLVDVACRAGGAGGRQCCCSRWPAGAQPGRALAQPPSHRPLTARAAGRTGSPA